MNKNEKAIFFHSLNFFLTFIKEWKKLIVRAIIPFHLKKNSPTFFFPRFAFDSMEIYLHAITQNGYLLKIMKRKARNKVKCCFSLTTSSRSPFAYLSISVLAFVSKIIIESWRMLVGKVLETIIW